jgi:hypothetical protein
VTYIYKGVKREQGWIYGFTEPYQIFILYSIFEKEGTGLAGKMRQSSTALPIALVPRMS